MNQIKLATVCLSGCYSCQDSSFNFNIDKWLSDFQGQINIVYSCATNTSEYPDGVDIALVEGSIRTKDNLELIYKVRDRSKIIISFGECDRSNYFTTFVHPLSKIKSYLQRCYLKNGEVQAQTPKKSKLLATKLDSVTPIQTVIDVDAYLSECPPNAAHIRATIEMLLMGELPHLMEEKIRII